MPLTPGVGTSTALVSERGSNTHVPARVLADQIVDNAGFSTVGASVLDPFFVAPAVTGGTTYNQASGSLNIVAPATANSEFLARSVRAYDGSMRMRFTTILSQRIANNNFAAMLADLTGEGLAFTNPSATTVNVTIPAHGWTAQMVGQFVNLAAITGVAGVPGRYAIASIIDANTVQFTVAGWPGSGSGTLTVFGRNYVRNLFTGTTATTVNVDSQRNGWATGDTAATINTTASPGTLLQCELTGREVFWSDALRASSTAPTVTTRASRFENIPDLQTPLYVFLWSFNGSTAPLTATTWTLGHLAVENFQNLPVYLQGARSTGATNPLPVTLTGTNTVGTVTTVTTVATLTGGAAAEDAATTANPHIMGGVVRSAVAPTTLVAGDAARVTMTPAAQLVVKPFAGGETDWQYTGILVITTAAAAAAARAAGVRNYVTGVQYQNTSATATTVLILDGATTIAQFNAPASMALPAVVSFQTPLRGTAATALNVNCGTTAANVLTNVQGYQAP